MLSGLVHIATVYDLSVRFDLTDMVLFVSSLMRRQTARLAVWSNLLSKSQSQNCSSANDLVAQVFHRRTACVCCVTFSGHCGINIDENGSGDAEWPDDPEKGVMTRMVLSGNGGAGCTVLGSQAIPSLYYAFVS